LGDPRDNPCKGKLFSHPNLGAGLPARPCQVRSRTVDGSRTTPIAVIASGDETPLKHGPDESPQNAQSSAKPLAS
jgi:hypothetical protein